MGKDGMRRRDHPEQDPNVNVLAGFDVTSLAPAEYEDHGIAIVSRVVTAQRGHHRGWMTHSEFLSGAPEFDVYERALARRRARDHAMAIFRRWERDEAPTVGELLRGLTLPRTFPCPGFLRVLDDGRRMLAVGCDVCGSEYGVARERERDSEPLADEHDTPGGW